MGDYNYFIKLLMTSTDNCDFVLLYGFCTPTMQMPYAWRQRNVPKTHQNILTAILPKGETADFLKALTQPGMMILGDKSFTSPELIERPMVLSNDGQAKKPGPVSEYRQLIEFWNIQKQKLFQSIEYSFETDGKELYQDIKALFHWAYEECGIDFLNNGYRLGNFEFYRNSIYIDKFKIETHKECGLTRTTIRKNGKFKNSLIVNCTSEHRERSVINQSKIFFPKDESLDFLAEEPMSWIVIQIWDKKSGGLIFSRNITLVMGVSISMNWGSTPYCIRDPWSEKLLSAAANRSDIIKKQIETVSRTTPDRAFAINSGTHNEIDAAMDEGKNMFCEYRHSRPKGAFVPHKQKDGEIDSFLKIREYITPPSVKKVTIADPYFSAVAAAKLLSRIPRTDVQIEIITSLGKTDPDTGTELDICEDYRKFLRDHSPTLHNNLRICNLRRGDKPVFHDRYLIRYFDNGIIDGFLLSNSLNSMGQFYPFVIAPMEHEVCLDVCDYLDEMCNATIQSKLSKKERITCDALFDSKAKVVPPLKSPQKTFPLNIWLAHWHDADLGLHIPVEDLPAAVSIISDHWNCDKKLACQSLCMLGSTTHPWSAENLANIIRNSADTDATFLEVFISNATEKELNQNHLAKGLESQEYKLWALLSGTATPSRQGFSLLFEQAGHIGYAEDIWLHGGYNLLLWLHPHTYAKLMDDIKSPLMFDVLAARMLFYPWSDQLFYAIVETSALCSQLICAEWILEQLKLSKLTAEQVGEILAKLAPEKRALQAVRLISEITFYIRTSSLAKQELSKWSSLRAWLLDLAGSDIIKCTAEIQTTVLYWLFDCEDVSNCKLQLQLAEAVKEQKVRDVLIDEAIKISKHSLLDCSYNRDVSELVVLYLQGMDIRYGSEAEEEILGKIVNWNAFETATEPELKNYSYVKWNVAYIRAQRQMEILKTYHEQHPAANKTSQWIRCWEERLNKSL